MFQVNIEDARSTSLMSLLLTLNILHLFLLFLLLTLSFTVRFNIRFIVYINVASDDILSIAEQFKKLKRAFYAADTWFPYSPLPHSLVTGYSKKRCLQRVSNFSLCLGGELGVKFCLGGAGVKMSRLTRTIILQ